MTDKEIIQALECCIKPTSDCDNCPYYGYDDDLQCFDMSKRDALDLINRQQEKLEYLQGEREVLLEDIKASSNQVIEQQAEIEKLNVELVGMRSACNSYKMHYDNAKAEIERLEKEYSTATNHITRLENQIERLLPMLKTKRAEAIKEFANDIYEEIDKAIKNNQDVKKQRRKRLIWRGNNVEDDAFLHYVEGKLDALKGIKCFVFDYIKEMVGESK